MALSKKDLEFYEEKLSVKSAGYMLLYTMLMGAVAVPAAIYLLDASNGSTSTWTFRMVVQLSEEGLMLGCIIGILVVVEREILLPIIADRELAQDQLR